MEPHVILLQKLVLFVCTAAGGATIGQYNNNPRLGCHLADYSYSHMKPVQHRNGRVLGCSGTVTVMACMGLCDTSEIPDHQIPHKISYHRVCTYTGVQRREVTLDDCDPQYTNKTVIVLDAINCRCSYCNQNKTSCETLN